MSYTAYIAYSLFCYFTNYLIRRCEVEVGVGQVQSSYRREFLNLWLFTPVKGLSPHPLLQILLTHLSQQLEEEVVVVD
jgi:hypothetical protein